MPVAGTGARGKGPGPSEKNGNIEYEHQMFDPFTQAQLKQPIAEEVDYTTRGRLEHSSPESYACQLGKVWENTARVFGANAKLVIRLGCIRDRVISEYDV
jgi:hypothetical protein